MSHESGKERTTIKAWDVLLLIFLGGLLFGVVVAKHLNLPPPHHSPPPGAPGSARENPAP